MKGSNSRELIDKYAKDNNIELNHNIELASYTLVTDFSKIGFGIGFSTREYIQKELNNHELFELKLKEKLPTRYIGYATLKN